MTKDELVSAVQTSLQGTACHNFGKEDIKTVVDHTLGVIKDAVYNGKEVTLRGFGTFKTKQRKAKAARNISKGTTVQIPARKVVAFKPSKDFTTDQDIAQ